MFQSRLSGLDKLKKKKKEELNNENQQPLFSTTSDEKKNEQSIDPSYKPAPQKPVGQPQVRAATVMDGRFNSEQEDTDTKNARTWFTPQGFNMPGQPRHENSVGKFGTYTPGRDWDTVLTEIGSAINSDPNAGYKKSGLKAGFSDDYLKTLAESQIDPLNEAYNEAVKSASGDFNRLGLAGSGFEIGGKYGDNPDSITSRYLKEVGDVHRDVALRGAEAAREDRFNIHQIDEDARRYWTDEDFRRQATNKDYLQTMMQTGMQADQQDEANRQWWGNMHNQQFVADDERAMDRWRDLVGLNQWNLGRFDEAAKFNIDNETRLKEINSNLKQEAIKNMMGLLGMQSDADWRAIQAGTLANEGGQTFAEDSQQRWTETYNWLRDSLGGLLDG